MQKKRPPYSVLEYRGREIPVVPPLFTAFSRQRPFRVSNNTTVLLRELPLQPTDNFGALLAGCIRSWPFLCLAPTDSSLSGPYHAYLFLFKRIYKVMFAKHISTLLFDGLIISLKAARVNTWKRYFFIFLCFSNEILFFSSSLRLPCGMLSYRIPHSLPHQN